MLRPAPRSISLPTRLKQWSAHAIRYALLLLFVFGGAFCATFDRPSRTRAEVKGHYANANEGCNGRFNHQQAGGHLQVRHESSSGFVATTTLSAIHGEISEGDGDGGGGFFAAEQRAPRFPGEEQPVGFVPTPPPEPYSIASIGFSVGQQTRYFGYELGLHIFAGPRGGLNEEVGAFPVPWIMLQLGNLELGWAEFRVGPQLGLADNMLIAAGAGFNVENVRGTVGLGLASALIVDANNRDLEFNLEDGGFAVYGSVEWLHKNGWGLHVRAVTARDFALSAGLVLDLDTLFGGR